MTDIGCYGTEPGTVKDPWAQRRIGEEEAYSTMALHELRNAV